MATSRSRPPGLRPWPTAHRLAGRAAGLDRREVQGVDRRPAELLTDAVDRDHLLTNVMLYWLTGTAGSSAGIYYENMHVGSWGQPPSATPTGVAVFAEDVAIRRYAERGNNIAHWSEFDRGGHFAAMEAPDLLVGDVRTFFRPLLPAALVLLHGPEVAVGVLEEHIAGPGVPSGPSCWTSPTGTPRPARASRTASTSWTTSWTPLTEPGSPSGRPSPSTTEQAEPGGVSCTTRIPELGRTSWSRWKPTRSVRRRPWRRRRPRRGWGRPRKPHLHVHASSLAERNRWHPSRLILGTVPVTRAGGTEGADVNPAAVRSAAARIAGLGAPHPGAHLGHPRRPDRRPGAGEGRGGPEDRLLQGPRGPQPALYPPRRRPRVGAGGGHRRQPRGGRGLGGRPGRGQGDRGHADLQPGGQGGRLLELRGRGDPARRQHHRGLRRVRAAPASAA